MNLTEFRKLSLALYATDENDLIKMAGPISGLKRFLRRLLNKVFSEESKNFQDSNSELKSVLRELYGSFKDLENSIDDYDLDTYKRVLNDVRQRTSKLNELLSKMRSDVSKVENEAKDEIKDRYYFTKTPDEAKQKTTEPTGAVQEHQPKPEAKAENYSEPVISQETENLISNLAPRPAEEIPAGEEQARIPASTSVADEPKPIDLNTLPRSFPAKIIDDAFQFYFQESEIIKLQKRIEDIIIGDPSALGYDVIIAVSKSKIDNWTRSNNNKMPYIYAGETSFVLNGSYLSKPVRLYARIHVDTRDSRAYILGVKATEPVKSPVKKSWELRAEMKKIARNLGPNFWTKFNAMGQRLGVQPEVFLPIMYIESAGFNPQVSTKGGAAGLIQFLPKMLEGVGYKDGIDGFSKLTGEEQLDYIEKFISGIMSFNGGKPYKDSATYYVSNFWPDALRYRSYYEKYKGQSGWWPEGSFHDIQSGDPEAVIVESNPQFRKSPNFSIDQEARAYRSNPFLDPNKDGRITLGDLQYRIDEVKRLPAYQQLESALKGASNYAVVSAPTPVEKTTPASSEDSGFIRVLLDNLNMPEVPANSNFLQSIMQGLETSSELKTDMIEIFGKNKHVNGEFMRIASLVLSRDYGIVPEVFASDAHFQIVYPSDEVSPDTIRLACSEIASEIRELDTPNAAFRFYIRKDATSTLPPLPLERAQRLTRMFRVKNFK